MSYEFNFENKKNEFYNKLRTNYPVTPDNYSTHTSIALEVHGIYQMNI